ncbi:hypothetical protein GJ496_008686 [Pomphorhynchus laevis]|nr:hypothetical protein GJ496_008686 [Pomphorhynchus laevis]
MSSESVKSASPHLFPIPPNPDKKYPLVIRYCEGCDFPLDLCSKKTPKCLSDDMQSQSIVVDSAASNIASLSISDDTTSDARGSAADNKKHQTRGGKGITRIKKSAMASDIVISKQSRKGNKLVTIVKGLSSHEVDLDVAKKLFSQKFSCGCSKSGDDELTIQGDVSADLIILIQKKWTNISEDNIIDLTTYFVIDGIDLQVKSRRVGTLNKRFPRLLLRSLDITKS